MRYMMLIHYDEEALVAAPQQELWADFGASNQALAKAGQGFAAGERLQESDAATTVRIPRVRRACSTDHTLTPRSSLRTIS